MNLKLIFVQGEGWCFSSRVRMGCVDMFEQSQTFATRKEALAAQREGHLQFEPCVVEEGEFEQIVRAAIGEIEGKPTQNN